MDQQPNGRSPVTPSGDSNFAGVLGAAFPELDKPETDLLGPFFALEIAEPGALAVAEGDTERSLRVVVCGEGKLLRGGVEIASVRAGDRIGDLSFVTSMPAPASLIATTRLEIARLPFARLRLLSEEHPALGRVLVEALTARLAKPASSDGVDRALVRERSLPRSAEVAVRIHGIPRIVPTGTPVRNLLPDRLKDNLVVAALLDRRAVSLVTPITSECEVSALSTGHWEGKRIFQQSIALLLLEAGHALGLRLEMGPSLGFAQQVIVRDPGALSLGDLAVELNRRMVELAREGKIAREEWWTIDEAREHFEREGDAAAQLLSTWRDPAVPLVSYGSAYALAMGPLVPDTRPLEGFHVLAGDGVLLLAYGSEAAARPMGSSTFPIPPMASILPLSTHPPPAEEPELAYVERHAKRASAHAATLVIGQEQWLSAVGVKSVGAFNRVCIDGEVSQLIRVSEGFHEKCIGAIADDIKARLGEARIVTIAGPSSSGKTTFIRRLAVQLEVNGIRPKGLSLDDYYVDRKDTPRDDAGEYDYEALEALSVPLLEEHLGRLLAGDEVTTARYDFQDGTSQPAGGRTIRLGDRDVLLLEGIHGLNPGLLASLPAERIFRVFACPLAQLPFDSLTRVHASDVRLLRRIVRDRHSRGARAEDSILRWPSVRSGERRHIFPFQHHADAVFDSSLVYELSVLRVFAERYLLEVPQSHPAYGTAFRLIRLLDRFVTIYPDHVPPTSILREFIGGSGFEY